MPDDLTGTLSNTLQGENLVGPQNGAGQADSVLGGNLSAMSGLMGFRQDQSNEPPPKIKMETDEQGKPQWSVDLSDAQMKGIMGKMSYLEKALQAMTQEADRLQQREQQVRQHPLLNVLSQVAGNLATTDKRLPPLVAALGRSSLALNPTPDQLGQERMGLQGKIAQTAGEGAQLGMGMLRENRMEQKAQADVEQKKVDDRTKLFKDLGMAAQGAALSDAPTVSKMLQDSGMPKGQADTQAAALVGVSKERAKINAEKETASDARKAAELAQREKASDQRLAVLMAGLSTKKQDKENQEKSIEEAAQALAPMNKESLMRSTDIAGMMGGGKTRIFARAREINPKFNWGQIERMRAMETSFTSGKDSKDVQSFDTFLQHAGEITRTVEDISLTNSPYLNKTLNWWRRNMVGTPELAALETSLEPAKKEFEKFLLSQQALYTDDRKEANKLLNADLPVKTMMAAVKQMGKTAADRFDAMNHRYKRVMSTDIEDPFSGAAKDAAKRIGIKLQVSNPDEPPSGGVEKWVRDPKTGQLVKSAS